MIPGPYSICFMDAPEDGGDGVVYKTLKFGYDSAKQAQTQLQSVAAEAGVPPEECAVIRHIEAEESERFSD